MPDETNIFDELEEENNINKKFDFEGFLERNKLILVLLLIGLILTGLGVFLYKDGTFSNSSKVEIISEPTQSQKAKLELVVEISGAVQKPGVYKLAEGSRVEDLMVVCGGLSAEADRSWFEKNVNRAGKLIDGQKLYIAKVGDSQSDVLSANLQGGYQTISSVNSGKTEEKVNINTASIKELDLLPGIGPVYGQNIIDQRPYSNIEELTSRGVLKQNVYDKIKDRITVY